MESAKKRKLLAASLTLIAATSMLSTGLAQTTYEPYVITTFAGAAGVMGSTDGVGSAARFYHPCEMAFDSTGDIWVVDTFNHTLRKMTPDGVVTTVAGLAGHSGYVDGIGSAARFNAPFGVAVDSADNIYVPEFGNGTIRKITPGGLVSTLAGLAGSYGNTDGTGSNARFHWPSQMGIDTADNLYVADQFSHTIRKITSGGVVTTLAGLADNPGSTDGTGSNARFYTPIGVAVDSADNVYVGDSQNNTIRKITPLGVVSTLAGLAGVAGSTDGTGIAARFNGPTGIALDSAGNVFVADDSNQIIRKITPSGVVSTLAGLAGAIGTADGSGSDARFFYPAAVAVSNSGKLYIADLRNETIRAGLPELVVNTAVSRKVHGSTGIFDIELPLIGEHGLECRSGGVSGDYDVVVTFSNTVTGGSATVTGGVASVKGSPVFDQNMVIVNLTGVADAQEVTITLSNVIDSFGQTLPDKAVSMNVLIGDTNGDRSVSASDVGQTKSQSGAPINVGNFRTDINASGAVTAGDIAQVKANAGHTLP